MQEKVKLDAGSLGARNVRIKGKARTMKGNEACPTER